MLTPLRISRALNWRVALFLVLWLGLGLRLVLLTAFPDIPTSFDQGVYYGEARALASAGLGNWAYDARAPLYFIFLAANFVVSGSDSKTFVRIVQSLLDTTTIALVYGLAQLIFNRLAPTRRHGVGLLAAALFAFYPDYIFFTQTLWTETLFVFVAALGFYGLLRAFRTNARAWVFGAVGIIFGLATLTREVMLLFALGFVPLWLWLSVYPRSRLGLGRAAVLVVGVFLAIAPWTYHNYAQGQGLELISWQGGRDFWKYNARFMGMPYRASELAKLPRAQDRNALGYREGLNVIAAQPVLWVLKKSQQASYLWAKSRSNFTSEATRLKVISKRALGDLPQWMMLAWMAIVGLTAIGLVQGRDAVAKLLFMFYLLASLAVFFVVHYITRFRLGMMVFFLPYTAYGLFESLSALVALTRVPRVRNWPRLAVLALVLILVGATYSGELFRAP